MCTYAEIEIIRVVLMAFVAGNVNIETNLTNCASGRHDAHKIATPTHGKRHRSVITDDTCNLIGPQLPLKSCFAKRNNSTTLIRLATGDSKRPRTIRVR